MPRVDRRYAFPADTRKIGGKVYHYLESRTSKKEAEAYAEVWRNKGKSVRVVKVLGRRYGIYIR